MTYYQEAYTFQGSMTQVLAMEKNGDDESMIATCCIYWDQVGFIATE